MNSNSTDIRTIRRFGVIALIFFGCLSALGIMTGKPIPAFLFGGLSVLGIGFILFPLRLRILYNGWMTFAHVMGRAVTISILALAYYFVITPSALLKRLFGGLPIPMKPDRGARTYWVERDEPAQPKERFIKRY
jgi:hypothetical protein